MLGCSQNLQDVIKGTKNSVQHNSQLCQKMFTILLFYSFGFRTNKWLYFSFFFSMIAYLLYQWKNSGNFPACFTALPSRVRPQHHTVSAEKENRLCPSSCLHTIKTHLFAVTVSSWNTLFYHCVQVNFMTPMRVSENIVHTHTVNALHGFWMVALKHLYFHSSS